MIDFRYHLVSLISVFLALAVGIILGAGPLQGAIGDQLTDQVETLRTERNDLRDALDKTERETGRQLAFIEAAGPSLVKGALEGLRVAVVELDEAAGDQRQAVLDGVEAAGGRVVATTTLQAAWTSSDHEGLRDTLADGMRARTAEAADGLAANAPTDEVIGAALGVALSGQLTTAGRSDEATALEQQLVQAGLIAVDGEQTEPADIILVIAGALPEAPEDEDADEDAEASPEPSESGPFVALARGAQHVAPTVVVGPTAAQGDVVTAIRDDNATARVVSTVSGVETPVGRIVVPLAAAAQWVGEVGQYGFEDGASVLPPDVRGQWTLEEPEPEAPPEGEPAEGADPADGAAPADASGPADAAAAADETAEGQ